MEGVVQDTTGDVVFSVRFDVIAFKPQDCEILDGIVSNVNQNGIEVFSGPLTCYIKQDVSKFTNQFNYLFQRMPGYEYDQTLGHFTSKNVDYKVIKKDSTIRHKIETLKFEKN